VRKTGNLLSSTVSSLQELSSMSYTSLSVTVSLSDLFILTSSLGHSNYYYNTSCSRSYWYNCWWIFSNNWTVWHRAKRNEQNYPWLRTTTTGFKPVTTNNVTTPWTESQGRMLIPRCPQQLFHDVLHAAPNDLEIDESALPDNYIPYKTCW